MDELKGIEILNQFFTTWLHEHDFDIDAEMGSEFSVDLGHNILHYAPYYNPDSAKIFLEEVQKEFPEIVSCDDTILAIFHEIGHVETENEWEDKDWEEYEKFIANCTDDRKYFRHPIEWRATEWGCQYILDNVEEISNFWDKMCILMQWFYTINRIED